MVGGSGWSEQRAPDAPLGAFRSPLVRFREPRRQRERLNRHGIDNRSFFIKKKRVVNGRACTDLVPAFSRYIFTIVPAHQREIARDIVDLIGFVKFNGCPAVVPDDVMAKLLDAADADNVLPLDVVDAVKFLPGMRVVAVEGPFYGHTGQFVRMTSSTWGIVMFNDRLSAKIQLSQLERVESRREAARRRDVERGVDPRASNLRTGRRRHAADRGSSAVA
jgi:hypothetical protein